MMRSWLFVPGDSERKLARAGKAGADVLILDLEDSVALERKSAARALVTEYLNGADRAPQVWVRVNPASGDEALADLSAIMAARPDGIVQPKPLGPRDVVRLGHWLDALETAHGLALGATRILPIATEVAQALFAMRGYDRVGARLAGISWGAEDLAAALGASANRGADGRWSEPFALARNLALMAAAAASVPAIDTVHADFRDEQGLAGDAAQARADGFVGKLAIHPAQVAPINQAFTLDPAELAEARRIAAAFAEQPGAGVLSLDGRMLDRPHLLQAQRLLAAAGEV